MQLVVCPAVDIGNDQSCSDGVITHLPSSGFQSASYSWPVMSPMVGPVEEAFGTGPLRIILPMEVVIVSTYVKTSSIILYNMARAHAGDPP